MKTRSCTDMRLVLPLLLASAMLASACAYDLGDHPMACETTNDCQAGHYCYESLCIPGSVSSGAGTSGSTAGASGGTSIGKAGAGAGMPAADGGETMQQDAAGTDAAASPQDAGSEAGSVDAGPTLVAPYADCSANPDCNPGETCRLTGTQGVCTTACTAATQCSGPANGDSLPVCGADGQCRLGCPLKVGGGAPRPRMCPSGMECVEETTQFGWQGGEMVCYPP